MYYVIKGDSEGCLGVDIDFYINIGYVIIKKFFDFEIVVIFNIVFKVENFEFLVFGVMYNVSFFVKFMFFVIDVNEVFEFF